MADTLSSDDDDDLLLDLGTRQPKAYIEQHNGASSENTAIAGSNDTNRTLRDELIVAQGEASMLRDKIFVLNEHIKRDAELQLQKVEQVKSSHRDELAKTKLELQNLEDEKKFLLMEIRRINSTIRSRGSSGNLSSINTQQHGPGSTDDSIATQNNSKIHPPTSKKRKTEKNANKTDSITFNTVKVAFDDSSEFFDFLLLHKLVGADLSTIQILHCIELKHIKNFDFKGFRISKDESLGKSLIALLMSCKKNLALDEFIDKLLEKLAVLIKEISLHKEESDLAIPFLVAIMYQTILFRPSAVQPMALKDLLHFVSDLIKAYQHVLKQPLHEQTLETFAKPQIFQYEMIDFLIILYSFDTLEISLKILRSLPSSIHNEVLDSELANSLKYVCKCALTISYRPITNIIFSTIDILNTLSSIMVSNESNASLIDSQWWKNCIPRLYHILNREIRSFNLFSEESHNYFCLSRFHDCFGLIRNLGTNCIGNFIPKLIYKEKLQSIPRVISKDDIPVKKHDLNVSLKLERWFLLLKDDTLNILENLMLLYPNEPGIINGEMLIQLTRLMAKEQEHMIEIYIGQDSNNLYLRCLLIKHLLTVIFRLCTNHEKQLGIDQIKEIESELVMALWRIIATEENQTNINNELSDHSKLVNKLYQLELQDEISYYTDAFEDMPEFVKDELKNELHHRTSKIMQIEYDECDHHMARVILESKFDSMISMEDIDSLYFAMGM